MPIHPLPRPVTARGSLLPKLIAPAVLGLVAACSSRIAIVDNADLSETGAHYIDGRWRGRAFHYEVGSAMPGDAIHPPARPTPASERLARQAARAAEYVARLSHLRPIVHPVLAEVPPGVRAVDVQRLRSAGGDALMLPLVIRNIEGDERYARHAVRRVAHESAHLVAAFHRRTEADKEWAAAVIESCAEQTVFGTTRGYVFQDELAQPPSSFDRAQRASVIGALRAVEDVRGTLKGDSSGSLHHLCERAFARLRPH